MDTDIFSGVNRGFSQLNATRCDAGILGEIAPITGVVRHSKFSATTAAMGQTEKGSCRANQVRF